MLLESASTASHLCDLGQSLSHSALQFPGVLKLTGGMNFNNTFYLT